MIRQPSIEHLIHDVQQAEARLSELAATDTTEYKEALKKFACAWFVLKMTRSPEDFLP